MLLPNPLPVTARPGFTPCREQDRLTTEQYDRLFKGDQQAFMRHLADLATARAISGDPLQAATDGEQRKAS